jgi:type I restriction enzyme R subunit
MYPRIPAPGQEASSGELEPKQTLSRLNRIHPKKSETFVLDFRNELDEIQEAFRP